MHSARKVVLSKTAKSRATFHIFKNIYYVIATCNKEFTINFNVKNNSTHVKKIVMQFK